MLLAILLITVGFIAMLVGLATDHRAMLEWENGVSRISYAWLEADSKGYFEWHTRQRKKIAQLQRGAAFCVVLGLPMLVVGLILLVAFWQ